MTLRSVNNHGTEAGLADAHGPARFKGSNVCALLGPAPERVGHDANLVSQ
jgi:hypothetical protein